MSIKVRDYLREYVAASINVYQGEGSFDSLDSEQQNNITRYVELRLFRRLRPIGAAPPENGESETCENLLEILKNESEEGRVKLVKKAVFDYFVDVEEEGKDLGDYVLASDDPEKVMAMRVEKEDEDEEEDREKDKEKEKEKEKKKKKLLLVAQ